MGRILLLLALMIAGCGPSLTVDNNIGMVKDDVYEEAVKVLANQGIRSERGSRVAGATGVRVAPDSAFMATNILLQWRRGKDPGAYITHTELEMQLGDR